MCRTPREALVIGSEGWIRIHPPLTHPESVTRELSDGTQEAIHLPHLGNGYTHEVIEVMDCLRQGRLESSRMPLDETLDIMKTLDAIRRGWTA